MVADLSAAAAWIAVITAICGCASACVLGYYAHQRRMQRMRDDEAGRIRAEQSMLSGDQLELALTQAKLDLMRVQERTRFMRL